jgi:tetratricopeptide (TPR) repeat protein
MLRLLPIERWSELQYTISCMQRNALNFVSIVWMLIGSVAHAKEPVSLGEVNFQNSCLPSVQVDFERAVALLHSFEFPESEEEFRKVEVADSTCAIAAWGVALGNTERLGPNLGTKQLAEGWKELQPWLSRPAKTEREQMYLTAVSKMYVDYEHASASQRWSQYIAAMQQIRAKYPSDINASLFYSLALVWTAGAGPAGIEQRRAALDILLPIFASNPDNPGTAHYIIHAADIPELALIALPAARKYASIAPYSPHALHMPSHIFNRLGYWQESIDSNHASERVAEEWMKDGMDGMGMFDELHALANLNYGYLQLGRDTDARSVIDKITQVVKAPGGDPWAPIDARIYYDLETHDWQDALKIQPPTASPFTENFDVYWIHAIASARLGKPEQAALALDDYRKSSTEWTSTRMNIGSDDELHIALMQAGAWTLFAQGKQPEAVKTLKSAIDFEQSHPLYYADVLPRPSAEMLGDMLSEMNRPAEALVAYKVALEMAPNTLDSLQGAQITATKSGQSKLAQQYADQIESQGRNTALRP